jgi:hypothetical protein
MNITNGMIEEFSFSSEDNIAGACSGALRRVRNLADKAPIGRLFASISTLAEASSQINQSLNSGDLATAAQRMKKYATPTPVAEDMAPLPIHFKRLG